MSQAHLFLHSELLWHERCSFANCSLKLTNSRLAAVAGTQEPEYGPEAIQPVGKNAGDPTHTEVTKKDMKWVTLDYTNVESQTFYLFMDSGHVGFLQVIYSNVA